MDTTRRGFMGLLAAFGLASTLPLEAIEAEAAPVLSRLPPPKLGMWVRPIAGGEWSFVGALQSLSVEPERQYLEHLYRDPLTRQQHITHRTLINRQYRIEAELGEGRIPDFLHNRVSLRFMMGLDDGEHEITVENAVIRSESVTFSNNLGLNARIEAVASGLIAYRTPEFTANAEVVPPEAA